MKLRSWLITFSLVVLTGFSLLEYIPWFGIDKSHTLTLTSSPRPTPFIRRSGQRNVAHQIAFEFQLKDGSTINFPWENFRKWRQTFPYPHHTLLTFYRPLMSAAITNPSVLKQILVGYFCQDTPILRHFQLPAEPKRIFFRMGLESDVDKIEIEVLCR